MAYSAKLLQGSSRCIIALRVLVLHKMGQAESMVLEEGVPVGKWTIGNGFVLIIDRCPSGLRCKLLHSSPTYQHNVKWVTVFSKLTYHCQAFDRRRLYLLDGASHLSIAKLQQ